MKKKLIIAASVLAVVIIAGYGAVHYLVNFAFDKYFFGSALSSVADSTSQEEQAPEEETTPVATQPEQSQSGQNNVIAPSVEKKRLSKSEIISRVLKSPELTYKMASMVSYEDKRRVVSIILSNFTANELAEIAKNVSNGITSEYKSKMIAEAQSRLTGAQWQECMSLAYKYVEEIRPYVE